MTVGRGCKPHLLFRKDYLQDEQPRGVNLPKPMGTRSEPKAMAECSAVSKGGVLPEVTEEQPSNRGGLHREVDVLRLEDVGGGRPASREADVREASSNGVCCGSSPFSEAV